MQSELPRVIPYDYVEYVSVEPPFIALLTLVFGELSVKVCSYETFTRHTGSAYLSFKEELGIWRNTNITERSVQVRHVTLFCSQVQTVFFLLQYAKDSLHYTFDGKLQKVEADIYIYIII